VYGECCNGVSPCVDALWLVYSYSGFVSTSIFREFACGIVNAGVSDRPIVDKCPRRCHWAGLSWDDISAFIPLARFDYGSGILPSSITVPNPRLGKAGGSSHLDFIFRVNSDGASTV
jgi:hypothetical protein